MMAATKNIAVQTADTKKCDVEEMVKILLKLPTAEQEKLFYMMKGVELTVDKMQELRAG